MLVLPFTPTATLLLLTAGLLLITLEFNRPGLIVAGAAGLLATLLAIASIARQPHPTPALVLLALAAAAFARDLRRPHLLFSAAGALTLLAADLAVAAAPTPSRSGALVAALCATVVAVTTAVLARIAHRARVNKGLD